MAIKNGKKWMLHTCYDTIACYKTFPKLRPLFSPFYLMAWDRFFLRRKATLRYEFKSFSGRKLTFQLKFALRTYCVLVLVIAPASWNASMLYCVEVNISDATSWHENVLNVMKLFETVVV